jgi:single-strand DNA-binding protein
VLNKAMLIGHLGHDPEVRHFGVGEVVANIDVATSETWKDPAGQRQTRTEWHRVVCFGRLAEIAAQYLAKGARVYVEGRLQTRTWQSEDGVNHKVTEIVGQRLRLLDPKGERNSTSSEGEPAAPPDVEDDYPF